MSSLIAIPTGPCAPVEYEPLHHHRPSTKAAAGSSSSSYSSPSTPEQSKPTPPSSQKQKVLHSRRPSLLSSAISKEECTVINIGEPDGPPRLISYLESSQGFTWNPEIFLPSYVDFDYTPLEHRREPVHEILVSDEEVKQMLPQ